jgi:hypothetical protein
MARMHDRAPVPQPERKQPNAALQPAARAARGSDATLLMLQHTAGNPAIGALSLAASIGNRAMGRVLARSALLEDLHASQAEVLAAMSNAPDDADLDELVAEFERLNEEIAEETVRAGASAPTRPKKPKSVIDDMEVIEFESAPEDPSRPAEISVTLSDETEGPDYVENRLEQIGFGILLGGYLLFLSDLDTPIFVPDAHFDYGLTEATAINNTVYATRERALEAVGAETDRFGFYRSHGDVIVPTVFSPATTPRVIVAAAAARRELAEYVQHEMTVLAMGLTGVMLLRVVLNGIVRIGFGGKPRPIPPQDGWKKVRLATASPEELELWDAVVGAERVAIGRTKDGTGHLYAALRADGTDALVLDTWLWRRGIDWTQRWQDVFNRALYDRAALMRKPVHVMSGLDFTLGEVAAAEAGAQAGGITNIPFWPEP